jgi:hypothetical protein
VNGFLETKIWQKNQNQQQKVLKPNKKLIKRKYNMKIIIPEALVMHVLHLDERLVEFFEL